MKKVTKNFDAIPAQLRTSECAEKIKSALQEKGNHKFSTNYYAHISVKTSLVAIYNNKCAFCENDTTAGAALQVEHYRPKAKVTDNVNHPGYYWLGYEWSNLLYSCSKCNRAKSNQFPLKSENNRVFTPTLINNYITLEHCRVNENPLVNEEPLLINPEIENPERHLQILPSGTIRGLSPEGIKTIEVCNLNRRRLYIARKKILNEMLIWLIQRMHDYNSKKIKYETLEYSIKVKVSEFIRKINRNESFTQLIRAMLKHYELYFIRRFGRNEDKAVLTDIFHNILSEHKDAIQ